MKQLLQSVSKQQSFVTDVPAPFPRKGEVLVQVMASLISAGTERTAVEFAEKNLLQKARSRPDLFRQVLGKIKQDGIISTWNTVKSRLDTELALGYSNSGIVLAVGSDVHDIKQGDAVACAGGGYASHAEIVRVPRNLIALIPKSERQISFEEAAFTTIASIAMQGFRLAEPQLGETVVVIGLGLIGLLSVQIAKAAGCRVLGLDPNADRCSLARKLGCDCAAGTPEELQRIVSAYTNNYGADVVLITAATTSNRPIQLAGELARQRGRVIVVGAVGLQLSRQPFYEKELTFRISCSYGPGRYDSEYEEKGHDYPIGFARWTENRNMQSVLQLMADGKLNVESLISHRLPIEQASRGYDLISGKVTEPFLGIVILYPNKPDLNRKIIFSGGSSARSAADIISIGMIGAGNFATSVLLPAMKKVGDVEFEGLCANTGSTAYGSGCRMGFRYCTTDPNELLQDDSINTIVIATRHDSHARLINSALKMGKNVFCEKPLCVTESQLSEIVNCVQETQMHGRPLLMIGFNRRFSRMGRNLKRFVSEFREPVMIQYRVNAGFIPSSHWTQNLGIGGGRIVGELCHFVDFCTYLTGRKIMSVQASKLPNGGRYCDDNLTATLKFEDGSIATITYIANGNKNMKKERIEVFGAGSSAVLDDFRTLTLITSRGRHVSRSRFRQDKGHVEEWRAFVSALKNGDASPISFEEIANTTLATFAVIDSISSSGNIKIRTWTAINPDS